MTVCFDRRTELAADIERCYQCSLDVDLHTASMATSGERAVAGIRHGQMGLGDTVTWNAHHLGRDWSMTSKITEADPPHRFVDEQIDGPFASFRHEHLFRALHDTTTEMVDHVEFRAPLGPLGRIAELLVLRWYIPRLIDLRNATIADAVRNRSNPAEAEPRR